MVICYEVANFVERCAQMYQFFNKGDYILLLPKRNDFFSTWKLCFFEEWIF
jgi:hypothetical protein